MNYSGIYVHIPFCHHKCIYCDFYSVITTKNSRDYLHLLMNEMEYRAAEFANSHSFDTVFFGGGTPSAMEPEYIRTIIDKLKLLFNISPDCEITLESNPGTLDIDKLKGFKNAGVNRISIGIQSFDANDLEFLTRIHSRAQALEAVHQASESGISNINIDLIFNLPGQTRTKWSENLRQAFELPITHLSAYSLILEPGTILNKMVLDGKIRIADEDHDADLYESAIDYILNRGFIQYEVSNFCRPGFECRHNNHYWKYDDYLGFGTSAHSFMNGRRWWNYTALSIYNDAVTHHGHARAGFEDITPEQAEDEYLMLSLRSGGLDVSEFNSRFPNGRLRNADHIISELTEKNYLTFSNGILKLTPLGYSICDEILTRI